MPKWGGRKQLRIGSDQVRWKVRLRKVMLLNTWPTVFYSHRHAATLPSINSTSPTKLCNDDARHHGGLVDPLLLVCGHTTSAASGPTKPPMSRHRQKTELVQSIHLRVVRCAYRVSCRGSTENLGNLKEQQSDEKCNVDENWKEKL